MKMEMGEDFLPSLVLALEGQGVESGLVLGGIGALLDFELGWFDLGARQYVRQRFPDSHELLTIQGSLTLDSDPQFHLHASLADSRQEVVGGHFFGGVVAVLAEVVVEPLEELRLSRGLNPKTGLRELTIEGGQRTTK